MDEARETSLIHEVSSDDQRAHARPDVRLLLPALLTWSVVALTVGRGPLLPGAAAASLGSLASLTWRLGRPGRNRVGTIRRLIGVRQTRPGRSPKNVRTDSTRSRSSAAFALGLILGAALLLRVTASEVAAEAGPVAELARERATVTIQGRASADPRLLRQKESGPSRVALVLLVEHVDSRGLRTKVTTPVLIIGGEEWRHIGWRDVVEVRGRLAPATPGEQVRAVLTPRGSPTVRERPGPLLAMAAHIRERMRSVVAPLPEDARGLLPAMVVGDRDGVPDDLADAMTATGMSHLTAVSGTNCTLVVAAVVWLCGLVGVPRRVRPACALVSLAAFVLVARPDPSVIRAAVMGAIGLIGLLQSRRALGMPALAGAVLVLLAVDPWLSRSYGFALSALATLGLLVFARPWASALRARAPWLGPAAEALVTPLAAQVTCAPVIVLLQGEISVVGILTNALAAPLVAPVTILGATVAMLGLVWPWAATMLAWIASAPATGVAGVARIGQRAPLRAIPWPDDMVGALSLTGIIVALVLGGAALWRWGRRRWWAILLVAAIVVAAALPVLLVRSRTGFPGRAPAITMCDIGQGDAFVLASGPRRAVVVDVGPDPDALDRCLDTLGIEVVDAVVLTHFDTDHVGGLAGLDRGRPVGDVVVSTAAMSDIRPAVERWWQAHGHPVHQVVRGDALTWGDVSALVRGPGPGPSSSPNAGSVVLDVVVDGPEPEDEIRALLLGDADEDAGAAVRRDLVARPEPPPGRDGAADMPMPFDIVKVAHHGSAHHDARLIRDLQADIALISVGKDNTYGHPAPSLLAHVEEAGSLAIRSDQAGGVTIRKENGRLLVQREKS